MSVQSGSIAMYAALRQRLRRSIMLDGPYKMTYKYIELPVELDKQPKLEIEDGDTVEIVTSNITVKEGVICALVVNPKLETCGLTVAPAWLTETFKTGKPLVVRVEAECDFSLEDLDYLARIYVFR